MSHDPDIAQAYREVRQAKRWVKERQSPRWKLAQVAATNKLPLNGSCAVFKSPEHQPNVGKRSVYKGNKT